MLRRYFCYCYIFKNKFFLVTKKSEGRCPQLPHAGVSTGLRPLTTFSIGCKRQPTVEVFKFHSHQRSVRSFVEQRMGGFAGRAVTGRGGHGRGVRRRETASVPELVQAGVAPLLRSEIKQHIRVFVAERLQ